MFQEKKEEKNVQSKLEGKFDDLRWLNNQGKRKKLDFFFPTIEYSKIRAVKWREKERILFSCITITLKF